MQFSAKRLIDLLLRDIRCDLGDLGRDVRCLAKEDTLIDALEQIPRLSLDSTQRTLNLRNVEQRVDQRLDEFAVGQATQRQFCCRKRRHQQ